MRGDILDYLLTRCPQLPHAFLRPANCLACFRPYQAFLAQALLEYKISQDEASIFITNRPSSHIL